MNKEIHSLKNKVFVIVQGDITNPEIYEEKYLDAIVNAANTTLLGGGGVDGAIHKAAGPELLEECKKLGGCSTGQAKITKGYNLCAKYIIHAVGPVWRGGSFNESELLTSAYLASLNLAEKYNCATIAFPAISTGAYGFPLHSATKIALDVVIKFVIASEIIKKVYFVCYGLLHFSIYQQFIKDIIKNLQKQ